MEGAVGNRNRKRTAQGICRGNFKSALRNNGWVVVLAMVAAVLAGCSTTPGLGGGGTVATGSTAGTTAEGANPQLEKCTESLGTLAVVEDVRAPWYGRLRQYKLGPTTPVQRMMIQQ